MTKFDEDFRDWPDDDGIFFADDDPFWNDIDDDPFWNDDDALWDRRWYHERRNPRQTALPAAHSPPTFTAAARRRHQRRHRQARQQEHDLALGKRPRPAHRRQRHRPRQIFWLHP